MSKYKKEPILKLFDFFLILENKKMLNIKKKVRYKHFMEDLAILSQLMENNGRCLRAKEFSWSFFPKILEKRIGIKINRCVLEDLSESKKENSKQ